MSSSKISFVLPIYNEEGNIAKLWQELSELESKIAKKFKKQNYQFEYIFINDASKDGSQEMLENLYQENPEKVKVIKFSRNYGHQIAVTAGQDAASGEAVIIMDTDLQDPPSVCLDLIEKWQEGYDVVYAQRRSYRTNFIKKFLAFFFYRIMSKIASVDIPVDTGDFRLISQRVNQIMCRFKEKNRFLRGISALVGFKTVAVQFDRSQRYAGKTGYTFVKSLKLAFDGITSFSLFPIRLVSFTGVIISILSLILGILYILISLYHGRVIEGWASIMFFVIFLGGIQILMLGIIGEYIGRIYTEVLNRPLYTVEESFGLEEAE